MKYEVKCGCASGCKAEFNIGKSHDELVGLRIHHNFLDNLTADLLIAPKEAIKLGMALMNTGQQMIKDRGE